MKRFIPAFNARSRSVGCQSAMGHDALCLALSIFFFPSLDSDQRFFFLKEGWVEAMGASKVYGYISESPVSDQSLLCRW